MYTIKVKGGVFLRNELRKHLNGKGIMARVYFPPVHLSNFYRKTFGYKEGSFPISEKVSNEVLTLPMYPELSRKEMDYIAQEIKKFFRKR
jgi:dTDP-4-amino-4,6-dideoxygalactose transaminase